MSELRCPSWRASLAVAIFGGWACGRTQSPAPAGLALDRAELIFTATADAVVPAQTVTVTSRDATPLVWRATATVPWISLAPATGTTPTAVAVTVQSTGLLPGEHSGSVTFSWTEAPDAGRALLSSVAVRLQLTAPGWTAADGPWGGRVAAVTTDGAAGGRVLAGDAAARIWISQDGGATFALGETLAAADGSGRVVKLALNGASSVAWAAVTTTGVWRSADAGAHWIQTAYAGNVRDLAVDPDDVDVAYALDLDGATVGATRDGGATWAGVRNVHADYVDTAPGGEVFSGACNDTERSVDRGQTWASLDAVGFCGKVVYRDPAVAGRILIGGDSQGGVQMLVVTSDDGANWHNQAAGLPPGDVVAITRIGDRLIAASTEGLFASTDAAVWSRVAGSEAMPWLNTLDVVGAGGVVVAASALVGVFRPGDGSVATATGLFAHAVRDLAPDPVTGDLLAITDTVGLWRRQAAAWSAPTATSFYAQVDRFDKDDTRLVRDPTAPSRLLLARCQGGLLESSDGGDSWAVLATGLSACVKDVSFAPDDSQRVLAVDDNRVMESSDAGRTFVERIFDTDGVFNVVALAGGAVAYYGNCGVLRYQDSGGVAMQIASNLGECGTPARFLASPDGGIWVGSNWGVCRFVAGSTSCDRRMGIAGKQTTGLLSTGSRVWVGIDGLGLSYTDDQGATWHDAGCPSLYVTAVAVSPVDQSLWVATRDLAVLRYAP